MDSKDFGRLVWAPDSVHGFVIGNLADISTSTLTVTRRDNKQPIVASYEEVFPAEEDEGKTVEDNCGLMYLNEGTLLNNCRLRYKKKEIYTYVANILIAINPYEQITKMYSPETIADYRGKSIGQRPPHIYAIADKAYRDMYRLKQSQSIIVSGESGAGKTESQKAILKYLCTNWGSEEDVIRQRIKETNPILEAFGNAKTTRNNNSSRFGKFVEIHFGGKGQVAGGFVSHYLLEKSRVCKQSEGERSYHIFYQLIAGLDDTTYKKLYLAPAKYFNYLRSGATSFFTGKDPIPANRVSDPNSQTDPIVDDRRDFNRLTEAFKVIGMKPHEIFDIWRTVAGVLHLGNINFEDNDRDSKGGCKIDPSSENCLKITSDLIGIDSRELRVGLTTRVMQATKGGGVLGTLIRVPLKPFEAASARDALAKAMYSKLFDYLVSRINGCINQSSDGSVSGSKCYIGVLDIAGFEFFAMNSFEQFCINYCNEKLQNFFNDRILKQEQELYAKEGLNVPRIEFSDNLDCIDLFEHKATGLLDLLDEEARLPRATPQHYTQAAHTSNKGHFRLEVPRKSRLRSHRDMRDDEGFLIRHYAGSVVYHTQQFLEKNNDQLHHSLQFLIEQSEIQFICKLFESNEVILPQKSGKKLQAASVCNKFRSQLNVLLEKLRNTGTHFVRCIKPNSSMKANEFDGVAILSQLRCAGMTSVLKLMQKGFPSRTSFNELYDMYKTILPDDLARLHPRQFCKCLFRALGLNDKDSCFGLTKVFFRPGKFAEFDQLLRQDPEHMKSLISQVRIWLIRSRWRKAQYGSWMVIKLKNKIKYRKEKITQIQAAVRGYSVRKVFKPRFELYRSVRNLQQRTKEMTEIVSGLPPVSASKWTEPVRKTCTEVEHLLGTFKGDGFQLEQAVKNYEECVRSVDRIIHQLKDQVQQDEKEKIRQLEQKRREEEERLAKQRLEDERLEQERQLRKTIEEEREKAEKQWNMDQAIVVEHERKLRLQEEERRIKFEQERLDAQLASRLAQEDKRQTIIDIPSTSTSISSNSSGKTGGKYNLATWSYAELRDTINTSTDLDLLVACKDEVTHRLRLYNDWRSKNEATRKASSSSSSSAIPSTSRVPLSMMNMLNARSTVPHVNPALTAQRYFKVPISNENDVFKLTSSPSETGTQRGVCYAHFNGQYISRQIIQYPQSEPLLLMAGKDDLLMCDRPLDQTDLTRRKGAEILPTEFENMWFFFGGKPLPKWTP